MANTVVLGDLEKLNGIDSLRFSSISGVATIPHSLFNYNYSISLELILRSINATGTIYPTLISNNYSFGGNTGYTYAFNPDNYRSIRIQIGNVLLPQWVNVFSESDVGKRINITLTKNGNDYDLLKDGVSQGVFTSSETRSILPDSQIRGGDSIDLCCVETGGFSYINLGDYGSANLPSLPSGADGTISVVQWWKNLKDGTLVDQNFATPQLYKDTLTAPLTEDQKVIYTDATPFYGSNDPFWDPYNQDPTYSFTVVPQLRIGDKSYFTGGLGLVLGV